MKSRVFAIAIVLVIISGIFGSSHWVGSAAAASGVVTFPDTGLEDAIRDAIDKPAGDIYSSDLLGLASLDARERNIVDLAGLEHATSLIELNLSLNQISDISPLANLTNLTELDLFANQISDISPLANLTNLTRLMLISNQISDISPLANLTNLTFLLLYDNQIINISHLANLTNLTRLDLYYNQISDISPLADLTSLTILYLDNNQISDISPLASLSNLTTLALFENQISDISPLTNLTNLGSLQLQHNQISDISPLADLTNLMSLFLYNNQIGDISPLANLNNLTFLLLYDNQISDINPLVENEGLSAGDEVDLRWNPLSVTSVNTYIPQLEGRGVDLLYVEEVDNTKPITPSVTADGGSFAGTTELQASWNSADPESGISEYQYAVGTTSGGSDVVDWISAGTKTEVTESVVGLHVGRTYYFAVKAKNGQGLWSDVGTSNGIVVTAVILDFPSDWTDKQLFVPVYERPKDTPGTVVLGVHSKRDMWYLVKVYTRQGNEMWKEYSQTGWLMPYLNPWGEKTFTYTPRPGEEIKIEVSNDLNDDSLRALWCIDFATRSLLGVSVSPEVTDPEAFFVELLTFYNKYLQIGAYLGSGQYDEAVYHLGRALLEPMAMDAFYHLLVQLGVQTSPSLITAKIVGVLFHFGVNVPMWWNFIHNTGKEPFTEEIILIAGARTLLVSPDIRVTESLMLVEQGPYHSGETINAQFTVKNMGSSAIELSILTAGGRGPQGEDDVRDFSYDTAITLGPGDSHDYVGELFLSDTGHYHFFVGYQTSDGQWYTSVPTEGSSTNTLDIDVGPLPDRIVVDICSPGELRVYDPYGRVTGLVGGEVRKEIPDSSYYDDIVVMFSPLNSCTYEVLGTDDGTYGLNIIFVEDGAPTAFSRTDTPIAPAAVHLYSVDWDALSQREESVTVQIDADGDGTFEESTMIWPPTALFSCSSENPAIDDELTFYASESYDVDGSIISYEWDFGESNTSTGDVAKHSYSLPGEYLVSLVVVDNDGAVSTQSRTIQVRERQGIPIWGWAIIGVGIVVIVVIVLRRYRLVKR